MPPPTSSLGPVTASLVGLLVACGTPAAPDASIDAPIDAACAPFTIELHEEETHTREVRCDGELVLSEPHIVELWVEDGTVRLGDRESGHLDPARLAPGTRAVHVESPTTLHVRDLGPPPGEVRIARSLTWTDAALLDDRGTIGLARVMRTANRERPGLLLADFFGRFATTAHSERVGPARMLDAFAAEQGDDPEAWDLDALPFVVTGVHNRIDLANGEHCGELRVSLASIDPLHQPFHLIALYRQEPRESDRRPDGSAHCAATALRWARLSSLEEEAFHAAARAELDEALASERLLVIESLEFLISPWEWRQWFLRDNDDPDSADALPRVLDNRPLFQTVDAPRLNLAGPDRDDFLEWVSENAAALSARRATIPERFRAPSARVNDGVPWIPLDLSGVDPAIASAHPTLRQAIELVGCPACHATDADFVQTRPDRTFSPFYAKELVARAAHLIELAEGRAEPPPHGPLQEDPVLPP